MRIVVAALCIKADLEVNPSSREAALLLVAGENPSAGLGSAVEDLLVERLVAAGLTDGLA